jgi:formate C-acetyltransferase
MYYIWHSENLSATPDGRLRGEPFSANYAPSLDIPLAGPLSVIRDFSAPDMSKVCNGGPLTIELHDSVFTADDAEMKVAAMIAEFVRRGGHQLQLNTLNSEVLRDAQKHPERYGNLIVRVWGWSGKFIELDKVYQDHIIRRSAMSFA